MSADSSNASPSPARRFGTGALVLAVLATAVLAGGAGWLLSRPSSSGDDHARQGATADVKEQWQCPMHPSIVQDHPGDCPICGMKLVKVAKAGAAEAKPGPAPVAEHAPQWQCPMHPSIVQDHPGDCPVCGMKLVKVEGRGGAAAERKLLFYRSPMDPKQTSPTPRKDEMGMDYLPVYSDEIGDHAPVEGLAAVDIDPERQQLIGLKIAHVETGELGGSWRTSSRVSVDETRVHHVNVKFAGFMEHVYADFVGRPVRKGERLFSIYSPELLSAQHEYLLALDTRKRLGEAGGMGQDGEALVTAARRKLELWDVPRSEIDRLERTGEPTRTITFYSPATGVVTKKDVVPGMRVNAGDMPFEIVDLSRVWALADAYETDLRHVKVGMTATLTLKAFPNRTFEGRVAFIDPLLDPKTRTAKVRIDVPNPTGIIKPEMFGEVVLRGKRREGLRVPVDAVIHSGTKSVVFVALPNGKFQPREVKLGEGDSEFVEVVSGLERGEGVVTRANFLVDSESRLRASLAALSTLGPATPSPATPSPATPSPATPSPATPAGGEDAGHGGAAPAKSGAPAADPHAGHGR